VVVRNITAWVAINSFPARSFAHGHGSLSGCAGATAPKLLTEGARVDPDWMLRFLINPSLDDKDNNRNGVRSYLQCACPRSLSEND